MACGILVPPSGIQPVPPALEVHSQPLDHQASPWNLLLDSQGDRTWYISMSALTYLNHITEEICGIKNQ